LTTDLWFCIIRLLSDILLLNETLSRRTRRPVMPKESLALTLTQWEQLIGACEANAEELTPLLELREELLDLSERAKELSVRQDALNAQKQQVTRDLDQVKQRGREIALQLRDGVRSRYGKRSAKLTEFGMRPRKGPSVPPEGEPPRE
jgi:chromosome segregation ATPase